MYIARDGPNLIVVGGDSRRDAPPSTAAADVHRKIEDDRTNSPVSSHNPPSALPLPSSASASSTAAARAVAKPARSRRKKEPVGDDGDSATPDPVEAARTPRKAAPRRRATLSSASNANATPTVKRISKPKAKPRKNASEAKPEE
jgi:hypothetical protein